MSLAATTTIIREVHFYEPNRYMCILLKQVLDK
jgi:hypothetical protein